VKGYIFNSLLVAGGSIAGLAAGAKINESSRDGVFTVLGLVTAFIGIKMSMSGNDIIPIMFCLVIGTFAGSILRLEDCVHNSLSQLNKAVFSEDSTIDGFIAASTLFCIGSMTIIGSLKDGLYNDGTLIKTKSVMDGFAAFVLASRYGRSVVFSALTVLVVQGMFTIFSGQLTFLTPVPMMNNIDGVGGIIVLAIGLNLLKLKSIKTIDMLPALLLIVAYGVWAA
jgi:hypothetical protein